MSALESDPPGCPLPASPIMRTISIRKSFARAFSWSMFIKRLSLDRRPLYNGLCLKEDPLGKYLTSSGNAIEIYRCPSACASLDEESKHLRHFLIRAQNTCGLFGRCLKNLRRSWRAPQTLAAFLTEALNTCGLFFHCFTSPGRNCAMRAGKRQESPSVTRFAGV